MTMSSIVTQSLLAVALLSVAMVEAAPLESTKGATVKSTKSSSSKTKGYVPTPKALRRGKRNVILDEIPDDSSVLGTEEDVLREQLFDLSDDQLAVLAEIVQNEIDQYNPESVEAYEVIELPEYLTQPIEYMPRDRRSVPVFEAYDENDLPEQFEENQEVIFVPEEALIEAAAEEQDEIELRQRIAEIATILNERATRRLRFF
ncbi:Conserved secreted protein [Caenorhabditis elegans]|uniref:Conserved secreted protein n=1 Tax=Caenorhabditis elegans TaxID=6239 RepID=O44983_CAEEL|nr:Conserved secreted protein [Caenorhabditis elegans]CCD68629.1 Conserved secreted protein [Caenorhabditis elegans]|eukprot:NP_491951.2 Uncharacterized protein CELE_K02F2.5 [Caenorhabditis elegans]